MAVMALLIPSLGFPVVDALCHAKIPRSGSDERVGSRMTPSVLVLSICKNAIRYQQLKVETDPPTSTPILRFRALRTMAASSLIQQE